jgi:ABC-type nitrate/sulfonate/bicarbonate transport system permease component
VDGQDKPGQRAVCRGLGGGMIAAPRFADSPGVFAGIVEITVAGLCIIKGIALLRRRLLI